MKLKIIWFIIGLLIQSSVFAFATPAPYFDNFLWSDHRTSAWVGTSCDAIMGVAGWIVVGFQNDGRPACEKFENLVTPPAPSLDLKAFNNASERLDTTNTKFVRSGETFTLEWDPRYVRSCTASWDTTSLGVNASNILRIQSSASIITPIVTTNTQYSYTMSCIGLDNSSTGNRTVNVQVMPWVPDLMFNTNTYQVLSGWTVTLSWTGVNLSSCSSSDWTGNKSATGGTYTTPAITADKTYTLSCTGHDGSPIPRSVSIFVITPTTPTILIGVQGTTNIEVWSGRTLIWSVSGDVDACSGSGAWSGIKQLAGSEFISPTTRSTYTLTCSKTVLWQLFSWSESIIITINAQFNVSFNKTDILSWESVWVSAGLSYMSECTTDLDESNGNTMASHSFYTSGNWFTPSNKYPNFDINPQGNWNTLLKRVQSRTFTFGCTDMDGVHHENTNTIRIFAPLNITNITARRGNHSHTSINNHFFNADNGYGEKLTVNTYTRRPVQTSSSVRNIFPSLENKLYGYVEVPIDITSALPISWDITYEEAIVWWEIDNDDENVVCNGIQSPIVYDRYRGSYFHPIFPISTPTNDPKLYMPQKMQCYQSDYSGNSMLVAEKLMYAIFSYTPRCWDGIVDSWETCDAGYSNGLAGFCNTSCGGLSVTPVCVDTPMGCSIWSSTQNYIYYDTLTWGMSEWDCVDDASWLNRVSCTKEWFDNNSNPVLSTPLPSVPSAPLRDTCNPGEFTAPSGRICIIVISQ